MKGCIRVYCRESDSGVCMVPENCGRFEDTAPLPVVDGPPPMWHELEARVARLERLVLAMLKRDPARSIETDVGDALDYWLFGLKRPAGMSDHVLRGILRNRGFAEVIALVKARTP